MTAPQDPSTPQTEAPHRAQVTSKPVKILDPILANQIAAGEVVERPASAIKELIENALDAGSTALTIEIKEGGRSLMRVADNGHGMTRDDALLALERHATSKISVVDDLNAISTLGFRGEALPSIASVSRFQLTTRAEGQSSATQVRVEGGEERRVSSAAGRVGTELVIKDLFFNVPARRKFLKSAQTEAGVIHEAVQRVALAYPEVSFRFIKDGHVSLDLPVHHSTNERVRALFGARLADHLCPISWTGPVRLSGLVSHPSFHFSAHRHAYVFINGRFVKDRLFLGAIQRAFGQRLPKGRYPFYLIHLDIHPSLVDVNVHPAKTQVRFVNEEALLDLLVKAFKAAMRDMNFESDEASWRDQVIGKREPQRSEQPILSSGAARVASSDDESGASTGASWTRHQRPAHSAIQSASVTPSAQEDSAALDDATRASLEEHRRQIQARIERKIRGEGGDGTLPTPSTLEVLPPLPEQDAQRKRKSGRKSERALIPDSGRHDRQRVTQADLEAWRQSGDQGETSEATPRESLDETLPSVDLARGPRLPVSSPIPLGVSAPNSAPLPPLSALPASDAWSALRTIGRADDWWIQEASDGLLLTHLPTARAHAVTDRPTQTPLAQPAQVELSARALSSIEARQEALSTLGVELSLFGGSTCRLNALPRGLVDEPLEQVLKVIPTLLSAPIEELKPLWVQALIALPLSTMGRSFTLDWLTQGGAADPSLPPYSLPLSYPELSRRCQHLTPF